MQRELTCNGQNVSGPDGTGEWRRPGSRIALLVSVQAADFFGQGAVDILAQLGIDSLALEQSFWITSKLLTYMQNVVERDGKPSWKACLILYLIPRKPKPCGRVQVLIFR